MTTYAIHLKSSDNNKIRLLVEFIKSLDFVQSVEEFKESTSDIVLHNVTEGYATFEQIKQQYPNEWVLLADAQMDGINILGGKVLLHESDKRNLALKGRDLIKNHTKTTHFYTGDLPKRRTIGLMRKIENEKIPL
jgi:translation elongation factor EF-Ts